MRAVLCVPGVLAAALASSAFPSDTPKMSPGQEPCDPGTGTALLQGGARLEG